MKVSVRKEPGFKHVRPGLYDVEMDGRRLERVFRVDTDAGVAWVAATDADGRVLVDRQRGEVIEHRVYGPMRLVPIEGEGRGQTLGPSGL